MVAAVVSPSSLGSPATHSSPSTLFKVVHDHEHIESDWEAFYDSPAGEEEAVYQLMEELGREIVGGVGLDSERPKWTVDSSGKDVVISFNESRAEVWKVAKAEIIAYRARICQLTKKSFNEIDPVKHILELFMGKATSLMQLMMSELDMSYEKAAHFPMMEQFLDTSSGIGDSESGGSNDSDGDTTSDGGTSGNNSGGDETGVDGGHDDDETGKTGDDETSDDKTGYDDNESGNDDETGDDETGDDETGDDETGDNDKNVDDDENGNDDSGDSLNDEIKLNVKGMIRDATDGMDRNEMYRQTLITELKSNKHGKEILAEMVKQMGGKVAKTEKTNRKRALEWLEAEPSCRPFIFLSVNELKVKYRESISPKVPSNLYREC